MVITVSDGTVTGRRVFMESGGQTISVLKGNLVPNIKNLKYFTYLST